MIEGTNPKEVTPESDRDHTENPNVLNDQTVEEQDGQLKELQAELEKVRTEAKKSADLYMRALADFENLKRRSQKERTEMAKYGLEKCLVELLPALDSFDKAVSSSQEQLDSAALLDGVNLVRRQLLDALEKHGLAPVVSKGHPFNPNHHQAISKVEIDGAVEELVHEEFSKGYMLHERLIRPAMVSVAVPKNQENPKSS